jgi:serine phosphatase RsbU (regulator of sigma subunit)
VERAVPIAANETLFLYTDGVVDTLGEHDRFGTERLKRLVSEHATEPPARMLAELEAGLDRFQVGRQADDTAAVALRPVAVEGGVPTHAPQDAGASRKLPVT